jgi:hypothetical protein
VTVEIVSMKAEPEREPLPFDKLTIDNGFRLTPEMGYEIKNIRSSCVYWSKKLNASISCKMDGLVIVVFCHEIGTPIAKKTRGRPRKNVGKVIDEDEPALPPLILPWRPEHTVLFAAYRAYCAEQGIEPSTPHMGEWTDRMELAGWPGFEGAPSPGEAPSADPEPDGHAPTSWAEAAGLASEEVHTEHPLTAPQQDNNGNIWSF